MSRVLDRFKAELGRPVVLTVGVVCLGASVILVWLADRPVTFWVAMPAGALLVLLVGSQILAHADARKALSRSHSVEQQLRERDAMLTNVIEHAPQGVAVLSPDRRILNANPRLASMLAVPARALIGTGLDPYLPADYVDRVIRKLESREQMSESYESDSQTQRGDGSTFWVHWSCTPIFRADGAIDYFLTTFEDVTAKREADETAVANLAQLEKLNRLKSEFVSTVSHEFRTALVGIQGFSEVIRDEDIAIAEAKLLAEEIYDETARLNRMITEMLDFDRLEAGKLRLDLRPVDMNAVATAAIERAAMTTERHVLTSELADNLPFALGDSDRLTQVLSNLLSNAIKYSPAGGEICVGTRLEGSFVEVVVRDHGRGIAPEFVNRLFGRYERYEDKYAGKIIGTGLGLAITRQIVEMHGGKIRAESAVGQGSEFRFTIPVAPHVETSESRTA